MEVIRDEHVRSYVEARFARCSQNLRPRTRNDVRLRKERPTLRSAEREEIAVLPRVVELLPPGPQVSHPRRDRNEDAGQPFRAATRCAPSRPGFAGVTLVHLPLTHQACCDHL